jgi:biotin synthase-like enzyme
MIIQHIICLHFHARKIAVLSTNDDFGIKAAMESGDCTYCKLNVLYTASFRSDLTDFSKIISEAKDSGALGLLQISLCAVWDM